MRNVKKLLALIITLSLVLSLGVNVIAAGGKIENLSATLNGNKVTVSGTLTEPAAGTVSTSVYAEVLNGDKVLGASTFLIDNSGAFSGDVNIVSTSLNLNTELTVRVADYDGGTWYTTTTNKPLAVVGGYRLRLDGYLGLEYCIAMDNSLSSNADTAVTFKMDSAFAKLKEQTVKINPAKTFTYDNTTYYIFVCDVVVTEMPNSISATLTSGETEVEFDAYTVRDYLTSLVDNYPAEKEIARSMLNYGYYAQLKFGPTDHIYAEDQISPLTGPDYNSPNIGEMPEGVEYTGSSVVFLSGNKIKHYFKFSGDADEYSFTIVEKGVEKNIAKVSAGNDEYSISTDELSADRLNEDITFRIYRSGTMIKEFNYSAMNYARAVMESNNTSGEMRDLVCAFAMFYKAADAYKHPANNNGN